MKPSEYFRKKHAEYRKKEKMELFNKENDFSRQQYKYIDKIISYPESPNYKAYIGLAKAPLMKNKNGIGFKGVKLQSPNRELIQCSECGEWMQQITHFHLRKHKLTARQYKKKYGLNQGTSLCSDVTSNKFANNIIERNEKYYDKMSQNRDLKIANSKREKKGAKGTIERQNNFGTCPKQLEQKIVNHINRFHMLPTKCCGRDGFQHMTTLRNRHGSLNNIYRFYGLPTKTRLGRRLWEWKFQDGSTHFIEKGRGHEELYIKMKQKCKILK